MTSTPSFLGASCLGAIVTLEGLNLCCVLMNARLALRLSAARISSASLLTSRSYTFASMASTTNGEKPSLRYADVCAIPTALHSSLARHTTDLWRYRSESTSQTRSFAAGNMARKLTTTTSNRSFNAHAMQEYER